MTPPPTDIAAIAGRLTKAQREALLSPDDANLVGDLASLEGLARLGLIWMRGADFDYAGRRRPLRWQTRQKGNLVRAHLLSQQNGGQENG